MGGEVRLFAAGDEVYYAGSIARQGTNADGLTAENLQRAHDMVAEGLMCGKVVSTV